MKTVVSADKIAHLWVHRAQDSARTPRNNFSFEGGTLYSYSTPIAQLLPDDYGRALIFNAHAYSLTTARHQAHARVAIFGNDFVQYNVDGLESGDVHNIQRSGTAPIRRRMMATLTEQIMSAAKPRIRPATRLAAIARAENIIADVRALATVDTKRKALAKEDRAEARAMLRRLPDAAALASARDTREGAESLAHDFARDKYLHKFDVSIHTLRNSLSFFQMSMVQVAARAVEIAAGRKPEGRRQVMPTRSALRHAVDACAEFTKARDLARLAGKRIPADLARKCALLSKHMPVLQEGADREARGEVLDQWSENVKELSDLRARGALCAPGANSEQFRLRRVHNLALELSALDTEEEKAGRAAFIAEMERAVRETLARCAPERFNAMMRGFTTAAEVNNWSHCRDAISEAEYIISTAGENDAATMNARLQEMQNRYDAGTKEVCERALAAWYAGTTNAFPQIAQYADGTARLRVVGDTIETSQGASVPLSVAPMLWRVVSKARVTSQAREFTDGTGPRIGYYRLDRVGADGSIKAGCHRIAFAELARVAAFLGYVGCTA